MRLRTLTQGRETWRSPDGQIVAYEIEAEVNGRRVRTQTYSKAIATQGFEGEVETYEKKGHTFVKQPPRENGNWSSKPAASGTDSHSSISKQDNFTMYLSYAKDIAVALINDGVLDQEKFDTVLSQVAAGGERLYAAHQNPAPATQEGSAAPVSDPFDDLKPVSQEELDSLLGEL